MSDRMRYCDGCERRRYCRLVAGFGWLCNICEVIRINDAAASESRATR